MATTSLVAEMYNRNTQQKSQREENDESETDASNCEPREKTLSRSAFSLDSNVDGQGAGRRVPRNPTANLRRQLTRWRSKKPAAISAVYTNQCQSYEKSGSSSRENTLRLS